ncbi:DivIVA domain-containing protein [Microbacterium terrae]|uniref:DivIVA domain-containing protein n=1 Tax=Microbacterium terrae TaxID=69369 RepID=UPI0022F27C86|nr:DivIVA domain-containing protein [Microbacterium terrae]GLJ97849.1 hypothetical protein GCM10017594_10460 [Microbacterium terrae]
MMADHNEPQPTTKPIGVSAFDSLISAVPASAPATASASTAGASFTTAFRGYDKDEVDGAIAQLSARLQTAARKLEMLEERQRQRGDAASAEHQERVDRLEAQMAAVNARAAKAVQRLEADLAAANDRAAQAAGDVDVRIGEAAAESRGRIAQLEADLAATEARAAQAEASIQALSDELAGTAAAVESDGRRQFDEILRVAEDQASVLIRNATVQADRLLQASHEEILNRRRDAQAEVDAMLTRAQHDAQQVRLRIDTELTAHQAGLEREAAHAGEKVAQAEQEAAAIRSEAEKGAAALRSMVARETSRAREEADEAVREQRLRALEFEEALTRRQDDSQQEFLSLHNQAVAHAERITSDANEQVAASIEHAQRVAAKADDFDRLMRAQAMQVEAEAKLRANEHLDRARAKAERIIDTVTTHSQAVLRDAEDRTRQLRWQQHQLMSFMAEVKQLVRPEVPLDDTALTDADAGDEQSEPVGQTDDDAVLSALEESLAETDGDGAEAGEADGGDDADAHDADTAVDEAQTDGDAHDADGDAEADAGAHSDAEDATESEADADDSEDSDASEDATAEAEHESEGDSADREAPATA